jgi:signal transduction histidine kinase
MSRIILPTREQLDEIASLAVELTDALRAARTAINETRRLTDLLNGNVAHLTGLSERLDRLARELDPDKEDPI